MPPPLKPNDTSRAIIKTDADMQALEAKLSTKLLELREAKSKDVYDLTVELQRIRIEMMLRREVLTGIVDPTTHKEMGLMSRLLAKQGLDDKGEEMDRRQATATATAKLHKRGITPSSAPGLIRALEAIMSGIPAEVIVVEEEDATRDPDPSHQPTP